MGPDLADEFRLERVDARIHDALALLHLPELDVLFLAGCYVDS